MLFTVYDGLHHKQSFSEINFGFPKINRENFFSNKYITFYNLKIYLLVIFKFLLFPLAIVFKILNIKIVAINPHSIGSCVEELDVVIKKNFKSKSKLIFFCPSYFSHNISVIKTLFSKDIILLNNPLWTFLISPLSFYKSITISPYFNIQDNEKIIFPKQYYSAKSNKISFEYKNFAHFKLFKELQKFGDNNKESDYQDQFINYKEKFNKLKEKLGIDKKICVVHIRNENIYNLRNLNINNYYASFDILIKNNYSIILYYNDRISEKYKNKIIHIKNLNEEDKLNQLLFIYNCDLYIGNYSGPFHIADIFHKDIIVLDTVVFNHFITQQNFMNIPKKYFDIELKRFLNINEIFKKNIECVWDEKVLFDLNIKPVNLNEIEILEVINFYLNENKNFFNMKNFLFFKNIPNNKNLAINYIPKLEFLKDKFE